MNTLVYKDNGLFALFPALKMIFTINKQYLNLITLKNNKMKPNLINITAKVSQLKLNFDGSNSWKFETYISTLNYVYGYQLLDNGPISVIPADLLCPINDLNTIVYKLREYFETILDCQVTYKFDEKEFNGELCGGFDIYGNSHITITKN